MRPRGRICVLETLMTLNLKDSILQALEANDLEAVASITEKNRRAISLLIRLAYDKETLIGWRSIKAVGFAAKLLVHTDYDFLRETVRKLLWSLSDESGGIGWAAPEIIGEIVSVDPEKFADIIPLIAELYDIEEKIFRPGVVYALGRIAEKTPERVAGYRRIIAESLMDEDPLVKVYTLEIVKKLWKTMTSNGTWSVEYCNHISNIIKTCEFEHKVVWIYHNNDFIDIEVGEYATKIAKTLIINHN